MPHPRKVPQKGERYEDYGPKLDYVNKHVPIAASKIAGKLKKDKDKDNAESDKSIVKDKYVSDEFNMCSNKKRRDGKNDDRVIKKEDILRSCTDLAIDG